MAGAWLELLGKAVRSARRRAGLTQTQLGEPLLSKSFISQLEKGALAPSIPSLFHIAGNLHVPAAHLLALADPHLRSDTLLTMAEAALLVEGPDAADEWLAPLSALPSWQNTPRVARLHRLEGLRRLLGGRGEDAVDALREAAALHSAGSPETWITRFWLGEALRAAGHIVAAAREWDGLLSDLPHGRAQPPAQEPVLAPGAGITACLRAVTQLRLAALYDAMGDRQAAAEVLALADEKLGNAGTLQVGSAAVRLLWVTAQEAYHHGDLLAAAPCARMASLLTRWDPTPPAQP